MNPMKLKLLQELLDHLSSSQGMDLKSMLDDSKKPMEGSPEEESMESPGQEAIEDGKPKGLAMEKVSVMGKPDVMDKPDMGDMSPKDPMGDKEMSDDELEELLKKALS